MVNEYLHWLRVARHASPNTISAYGRCLRAWEEWVATAAEDTVSLTSTSPADVERFTARVRRGGTPAAAATVAQEVAILGSFYRWAQARYGWTCNPAALAGRPRVHNRQPRPIDDDVWLEVWTSDLPTDARVALGLGYFAGLRRAEIVSLRGDQVGRDRRLVAFTRKGGGEDTFDYGDVLDHFAWSMPHLEPGRLETPLRRLALQRGPDSLMPWQSLRPQALNRRLTRWLDEADRPGAFGPHMLRHSFATNLLRSGVPLDVACDLCNHSSPTITMRYVHTGGGRLAALRRVDRPQAQAL